MTWGCRLPTWSILGITRLQNMALFCSPSVGPFLKTDSDIFTQSGVFSLGMGPGIAKKVIG